VHEAGIPEENFYMADDTEMWSGYVSLRTRTDPATMHASIVRGGNNRRDTRMVALNAARQIDATLLPHQMQKIRQVDGQTVIVENGVSGMKTKQMLEWSAGFVARHRDQGDSVLILDRLGCHRNRMVLQQLESEHVRPFLLPAQA
jgi:hypothetical protein